MFFFLPRVSSTTALSAILSSLSSFLPYPHPIWSLLCIVRCPLSHAAERIVECSKEEVARGAKKEDSSKDWRVDACGAGTTTSGGRRDAEVGVMLYIEMQEGKIRMQRKKYVREHQATTACTLRLIEGCLPPNHGTQVTVYIDSWFCSYATAHALREHFQVDTIGCVKTAHKCFPLEASRWLLSKMERGEQCVFKLQEDEGAMWAVGWQDVHYKTYLATCGSSAPGTSASKKRQRANGRNYYIQVPRPSCVAEYASNMGAVDLHNRYRQGMLALHDSIKTVTWQTRFQNELFATCAVDAFLLAKYYLPKYRSYEGGNSALFYWLGNLLEQMKNKINENDYLLGATSAARETLVCAQIPIGKVKVQEGVQKGRFRAIQQRCRYCSIAERYEEKNRPDQKQGAIRTTYCCVIHKDVYMCKQGLRTCWQEHLAACKPATT